MWSSSLIRSWRRLSMSHVLRAALGICGCAGALPIAANDFTLVGPHPLANSTHFPTIHILKGHQGTLYLGFGDWTVHPGCVLTSYRPTENRFHIDYLPYSDSIGMFRVAGDTLLLPSIDPVHYEDFRELSQLAAGKWRDSSPA